MRTTIGEVIEARSATSSFDHLRIGLAVAVVAVHSWRITVGPDAMESLAAPLAALVNLIVPLFFGLSGFLVAGSLVRVKSLRVFLTFRALRIFPALTVEVVLSAILLGPLLTTLTLGAYVGDPLFARYLANAVGLVSFELPGVFRTNPTTEVNGSLWTVPYELECYVLLAVLSVMTATRYPRVLAGLLLAYGAYLSFGTALDIGREGFAITVAGAETARVHVSLLLVPSFVAGVILFLLRDRVPFGPRLVALSGALAVLCLATPWAYGFAPLPAAYLAAGLGVQKPPKNRLLRSGDYSYGVYLYAYPVQQAVWSLAPGGQSYLGNLATSLVLVSLFAAFSWHAVEKPCLRLKRVLFDRMPLQSRPA